MKYILLIVFLSFVACKKSRPKPPPPPPPPPPKANWEKIVDASGMATTKKAPNNGKYIGDVWSQWLGAPKAIKGISRFVNITELGFETRHFKKFLEGKATMKETLMHNGATFGSKLTYWDALHVARAIGMNVQINIDSSCNCIGDPVNCTDYHRCVDPQDIARAPLTEPGHMANYRKIYATLLRYLKREFPQTITHIQIENEPCYRSFNGSQYASAVRNVIPIIKREFPSLKIMVGDASRVLGGSGPGHGGECGAAAGNIPGVDIIGFHYALPKYYWSTNEFVRRVAEDTRALRSRYPNKSIWLDEVGIGRYPEWGQLQPSSRDRLRRVCEDGVFKQGGSGCVFLIIGGMQPAITRFGSQRYNFPLYSTDREPAHAVINQMKDLARRMGVAW